MQGNLDHPPMTIGMDQKGALLGFTLALIVVAAGWYFGLATNFFACVAVALCTAVFLLAPRLTISSEGLCHSNRLGKKVWSWAEFDKFYVYVIPMLGFRTIGCDFSSRHVGGQNAVLGVLWEMPAAELASLLNEARQRWAGKPLAGPSPIE